MMTLGKNLAVAAILTNMNALRAHDIIARRIAYMQSIGEDKRNTVSWRDAVAEMAQFGRAVSFNTWHLRTRTYA